VRGAYEEFLQAGTGMSDRARGTARDHGRQLSDRFVELQTRVEEARVALAGEAAQEAAKPPRHA